MNNNQPPYKQKLIAFLALGFVIMGMYISSGFISPKSSYKVGDTVKDFSLKNIDNQMVSLKSHAGEKGALVVFTCNHCPFSVKYEDRIIALHEKYKAKGLPVIAINPNDPVKVPEDSFDEMKKRAKEKNFTFPYIVDNTQKIAKAFGAERTPHAFLLSKKGSDKFVLTYIGAIDDNPQDANAVSKKYLEEAIEAQLNGQTIKESKTKAIGCTIKWL